MKRITGSHNGRRYIQYEVNSRRTVVVQQSAPGEPWFIYDLVRPGPKGPVRTIDHDRSRKKADDKALVYIKGLRKR